MTRRIKPSTHIHIVNSTALANVTGAGNRIGEYRAIFLSFGASPADPRPTRVLDRFNLQAREPNR